MVTQEQPYPLPADSIVALVMERDGVYMRRGSPYWFIQFRYRGRQIRESTRTISRRDARAYRKRRMAEFGLGKGMIGVDVPTLREASESLLSHILASKKSGHAPVRSHLASLMAHFGPETRIAEILPDRMERYITARQRAGLLDSSIYNELSTLRRCMRLQWKRQRILSLPAFPMPARGRARQGFFTEAEIDRLCQHLPPHAVNAVRFAWETGWRRGEIFGLRWADVDLEAGTILLPDSKNGEPRQLPFGESPILTGILREQRASASRIELRSAKPVSHVFHYAGRPLPEGLKRCWGSACRNAGLESRIFHDLRRSFIQRCEDLSVPRSSAMKITGHKTEAIYARYAIAPRASLAAALRKLADEGERESRVGSKPTRRER